MIIKDLRILNKLSRKYHLIVDKQFKYILNDLTLKEERELKKQGYNIKYFSGCFYPFIVKEV